jgi:single-stranded DNA-binding protein
MSLFVLATGTLVSDPIRRSGAKGDFATASLRVATDEGAILVSVIAFSDLASQLLTYQQGSAVAISGRARLSEWVGRDGTEHHGLSLVADQIAGAAAARRADAERRRTARAA